MIDRQRGGRRSPGASVRVTPFIVLWGSIQGQVPTDAQVGAVRCIAGHDLLRWLRDLEGDLISEEAAKDVLERMEGFRSRTWESATSTERP